MRSKNEKILMFIFVLGLVFTMTACGMSVDNAKKPITDGLKTVLQTQNNVALKVIPNGDRTLNINNKDVKISGSTFDAVKTLINSNTEINKALIDIIGSQVTDENIATIVYYAQKVHIEPEKLLKLVTKE